MQVFYPLGGLTLERVVEESETYTTLLLPGFELPLVSILAKAIRWDRPKRKKF